LQTPCPITQTMRPLRKPNSKVVFIWYRAAQLFAIVLGFVPLFWQSALFRTHLPCSSSRFMGVCVSIQEISHDQPSSGISPETLFPLLRHTFISKSRRGRFLDDSSQWRSCQLSPQEFILFRAQHKLLCRKYTWFYSKWQLHFICSRKQRRMSFRTFLCFRLLFLNESTYVGLMCAKLSSKASA